MKIYKLMEEIKENDKEVEKALKEMNDAHNKVKTLLMHDLILKAQAGIEIKAFKKEHAA